MFSTRRLWCLCAVALLTSSCLLAQDPQDPLQPDSHQPDVARLVGAYLTQLHYSQAHLDDAISRLWLAGCVDAFDPERLFFLASDIAEFDKHATLLDDQLRKAEPDLSVAFAIFARYAQRVGERAAHAQELLSQEAPFDFELEETVQIDRSEAAWATDSGQLDGLWRPYLKEQALRSELSGESASVYLPRLRERFENLNKTVGEMESRDVLEIFLSALCRSYDPHTVYLKPITRQNFNIQQGHSLEGIGAMLRREGPYTVITELVPGGPAQLSGQLTPQDRIVAVAQGEAGERVEVLDWRLDNVVKLIRGDKGSKVRLTILPGGEVDTTATREVVLVRDKIVLTANDAKLEIREMPVGDTVLKLGLLTVPSFYAEFNRAAGEEAKRLTVDVRKLFTDLGDTQLDGLVIDVRNNSGGSLYEAIELSGLFIEAGPIVQVRDREGEIDVMDDPDPEIVFSGPLVVLTSPLSASASEIFAGAIQDYGRGLVVGSRNTHGKGTVQRVLGLNDALARLQGRELEEDLAGAVKLTIAKFYRVSGSSTQLKGVEADIVLPTAFDGLEVFEGDLERALKWDTIDGVPHADFKQRPASFEILAQRSAARVARDPDFQILTRMLAQRTRDQERSTVSLHLPTRQKEKEAREAAGETLDGSRDYLLEEGLAVAADYLQLLQGKDLPELAAAQED